MRKVLWTALACLALPLNVLAATPRERGLEIAQEMEVESTRKPATSTQDVTTKARPTVENA